SVKKLFYLFTGIFKLFCNVIYKSCPWEKPFYFFFKFIHHTICFHFPYIKFFAFIFFVTSYFLQNVSKKVNIKNFFTFQKLVNIFCTCTCLVISLFNKGNGIFY